MLATLHNNSMYVSSTIHNTITEPSALMEAERVAFAMTPISPISSAWIVLELFQYYLQRVRLLFPTHLAESNLPNLKGHRNETEIHHLQYVIDHCKN